MTIKNESLIFRTAFSGILWGDEKTRHAKFESNRFIFRGGAEALKLNIAYSIDDVIKSDHFLPQVAVLRLMAVMP